MNAFHATGNRLWLTKAIDLALLSTVGGLTRLWGIGFDLPNLYHRDEAKYVTIPLRMLKTGDPNPHFFNYPSVFFYYLAAAYVLYFLFMASRGRISTLSGLTLPETVMENVVYRATMPSQFLFGRVMVVLAALGTIWLVYALATRGWSRRAGLVAGLLVALSPTHVRNSHFVAPDVPMMLVLVAALGLIYRAFHTGRGMDHALAGLAAGLAISTKYNAYPIVLVVVVGYLMSDPASAKAKANLAIAMLGCALGFLLGTPYAFFDLASFLNGLGFELRHYSVMADPGDRSTLSWVWYSGYLLRTEGPLLLLAAAEMVRGVATRNRGAMLLASFPVLYLGIVSWYVVKNDRTALTVVPLLAMLAGATLDRALTWIEDRGFRSRRSYGLVHLVAVAVVLSVLLWPTLRTLQINQRFSKLDVRTEVTLWLEDHLAPGKRVVGEYYSPLLAKSALDFRWVDHASDLTFEWYVENADYVVLVENRFSGFFVDPAAYPEEVAVYNRMRSEWELVRQFDGVGLGNAVDAQVYKVLP